MIQRADSVRGTWVRVAAKVASWVLTVAVAAFYVSVGAPKLGGGAVEQFVGWGYPGWFSYVIGAVEVGGAAFLLFPRFSAFAAIALGVDMVGALATELSTGGGQRALLPLVLLVLLTVIGFVRREPLRRLTRRLFRRG